MDAFSSYNQIRMYEPNQDNTFITNQGLYCYWVIPFGLKNAEATYQRLVNTIFKNQIEMNMKVYMDNMLVKSLRTNLHFGDLKETLEIYAYYW